MATVDLVMPKLGESIMEATVLKWLKQPGDKVQQDEPLLEIATDKVDSDVPSIADGILEKVFFGVNDIVPIGAVIATIRTEVIEVEMPAPRQNGVPAEGSVTTDLHPQSVSKEVSEKPTGFKINKFYSPLVMNIASSEGVSMNELESIPGTGNEGRVTKKDILDFVEQRKHSKIQSSKLKFHQSLEVVQQGKNEDTGTNQPPAVYSGNVEIIEMDRMRKLIAEHMVRSKHTSRM